MIGCGLPLLGFAQDTGNHWCKVDQDVWRRWRTRFFPNAKSPMRAQWCVLHDCAADTFKVAKMKWKMDFIQSTIQSNATKSIGTHKSREITFSNASQRAYLLLKLTSVSLRFHYIFINKFELLRWIIHDRQTTQTSLRCDARHLALFSWFSLWFRVRRFPVPGAIVMNVEQTICSLFWSSSNRCVWA